MIAGIINDPYVEFMISLHTKSITNVKMLKSNSTECTAQMAETRDE